VEKIEKHIIQNLQAHGHCNDPSKKALKEKVDKLVEKAREKSESSAH
jgi:hypothetical protein